MIFKTNVYPTVFKQDKYGDNFTASSIMSNSNIKVAPQSISFHVDHPKSSRMFKVTFFTPNSPDSRHYEGRGSPVFEYAGAEDHPLEGEVGEAIVAAIRETPCFKALEACYSQGGGDPAASD